MRDEHGDEDRVEAAPVDGSGGDEEDAVGDALREDGPGVRAGTSFDPTPYLRQLRGRAGGQDYLDVKWRLLWLRREHPDAEIVTEHVQIDPTIAIFKATVSLPTGGKATGYGSETAGDFGDFIEKAETKAIGRALNALGYGAHFGERGEELEAVAPPRPSALSGPTSSIGSSSTSSARSSVSVTPPAPASAPGEGAAEPPAASESRPAQAPIDIAAGRDRAGQREAAAPAAAAAASPRTRSRAAAEPVPAAEPDLADYSWSAFWPWARGIGLDGPKAVEQLIGRPTAGLTPAELRDLILAARGDG